MPTKIVHNPETGAVRFENFNYAGIVMKMLQPILHIFFVIQFNFLYDGYRNKKTIDFKNVAGLTVIGGLILLLGIGAAEVTMAEIGVRLGAGFEAIVGTEGAEALFASLQDWSFF